MSEDDYKFYDIYAETVIGSGEFDTYVNETNDLELAVALARRYTDLHGLRTKIDFNDNTAAILINKKG